MNREDPLLERINELLAECAEPAGRQNGKATRLDELAAEAREAEPVEPWADQTRGWLARLFERWSR